MISDTSFPPRQALSWDDIAADSLALAARLPVRPWKGIVAVARGGLIPAALIALQTGIRRIETVCMSSYDGTLRRAGLPVWISGPELEQDGQDWLVIDDLTDSGATFSALRSRWSRAFFACLLAKPDGTVQTDLFLRLSPQSVWIDFPWEAATSSSA